MNPANSQPELFKTPKAANGSLKVTIELSGLGPIPSFKNAKLMRAWVDKHLKVEVFHSGHWWVRRDSLKVRSMLYTDPEMQKWMDRATSLIESQLLSALATTGVGIQTAACQRSLIATLLPLDDCWTSFRELKVSSALCAPGNEGATIEIERI